MQDITFFKVSDCCLTPKEHFFQLYHGGKKYFLSEMQKKVRFVLDQHDYLDSYSTSSLKQQFHSFVEKQQIPIL